MGSCISSGKRKKHSTTEDQGSNLREGLLKHADSSLSNGFSSVRNPLTAPHTTPGKGGGHLGSVETESLNSFIDGPELETTRDEFSNGDWYEGEHIKVAYRSADGKTGKKALKHGKGTYSYACGSLFEGYYFEDRMLEGRFYNAATKTTYYGHFKDDMYHGKGRLTYPIGNVVDVALKDTTDAAIVVPVSTNGQIDSSADSPTHKRAPEAVAEGGETGGTESKKEEAGEEADPILPDKEAHDDAAGAGGAHLADGDAHLRALKAPTEVEYLGDFLRGQRHGEGKLTLGDGSWIEGLFNRNVLLASVAEELDEHRMNYTAVRHFQGGIRYEGTFNEHYELHTLNLPDEARTSHRDSQIAHDAGSSHSKLTFRDGSKVSARFSHGSVMLPAELTLPSGDAWFGGLSADYKACGEGKMRYANGDVYIGTVKMGGLKEGNGLQISPNGSNYKGEYVNDQFHGRGAFKFVDGATYEGEWSYGLRHGYGTMTYKTGNVYEGCWKEDKKHGQGKAIFLNGDTFTGSYLSDRRDGDGLTTFADTSKPPERALYKNGQLVKVKNAGKVKNSVKFLGRKLGLRQHGDPV